MLVRVERLRRSKRPFRWKVVVRHPDRPDVLFEYRTAKEARKEARRVRQEPGKLRCAKCGDTNTLPCYSFSLYVTRLCSRHAVEEGYCLACGEFIEDGKGVKTHCEACEAFDESCGYCGSESCVGVHEEGEEYA